MNPSETILLDMLRRIISEGERGRLDQRSLEFLQQFDELARNAAGYATDAAAEITSREAQR